MQEVLIAGRLIGSNHPCLIIAEAGVNHNGDLDLARRLVSAAAKAGADAVKFQTFKAQDLAVAGAPMAEYQEANLGRTGTQQRMLARLELKPEWHRELQEQAQRLGLMFLSTPFDEQSADFLEALGVPAFKISSGDITNLPFLGHVAQKGRPMLVSTGMATLDEVAAAVKTIRDAGNSHVVLLHCVTKYPAEPADMNLRAMRTLAHEFGVPVGLSDHTLGIEVALAAVALGACVIEKHLTLDRSLPGPDHKASVTPEELGDLIRGIRRVEAALGDGIKAPSQYEKQIARVVRKSLVVVRDLPAGTRLTADMLAAKRPGTGISPAEVHRVVGRTLLSDVRAGTLLSWAMLE